jgi:phosphatidylserine decarboxylase
MKHDQLQYIDRDTGQVTTDRIYASGFLDWCYNNRVGWLLSQRILNCRFISRVYGWYYKRRWTRRKIPEFVEQLAIDTSNCLQPLGDYESFNDFIVRRIDLRTRPINPEDATCVSPADARVWVEPTVSLDQLFTIKSATFQLGSFLRDSALAAAYEGGTLFIFRLYLGDYHHFHFPDAGTPSLPRSLLGKYYAVTPYSSRWLVPYFAENHRHLTLFDSKHFGRIVMADVGAFTVGSIRQCFRAGELVQKGSHKGYFELGGSIVVLLFMRGRIEVDPDLLANSSEGMETYLRMGQSIGRAP